jgi:HEAT repeat protein
VKHLTTLVAACAVLAFGSQARSAELPLPKEGWASWQVEAVEGAPFTCCWSDWDDNLAQRKACNLDDGRHENFGTRDHETTDAVRVYARFAGGKLERLRTFAAGCPVEAGTPIQALEGISADDSARWLTGLTLRDDLRVNVLSSLAVHRGDRAFDTLKRLASGEAPGDRRNQAIFWIALARGLPGAEYVTHTMFNDRDAGVRKHAAFAVTVSKSPTIATDLARLGDTDKDADVRAQAWFWLAHTGAPGAEQSIAAALRKDTDDHVREQAVFALSQLPDGRGAKALIAVAEDRSLTREQRRRAVFWLGQSDSADAQGYLDKVLMGKASP